MSAGTQAGTQGTQEHIRVEKGWGGMSGYLRPQNAER